MALVTAEEIVCEVMHHGRYQRRILQCAVLGMTAMLMEVLAMRVIARRVDHWCRPPVELAYLSADIWKNTSIPVQADGNYSRCTVYVTSTPETTPENRTVQTCRRWNYDIKDWRDSIVSRFDLVCDRSSLYTIAALLPSLAYALLSPIAGFLADSVGRRLVTRACAVMVLISGVGSSVAGNYAFFLISRLLMLTACSATYLVTFVLVYEVTGKAKRWLYTLLHMAVVATLVPPFVDLLSRLEASWALTHAIFIAPVAVYTVWCFALDESPAWLLTTGRVHDAEVIALAAAKLNGVNEEKARASCHELRAQARKLLRGHGAFTPVSPTGGIVEDHKNASPRRGYLLFEVHLNRASIVAKATVVYGGYDTMAAYVQVTMKVVASASMSVVMCYVGDIFPTKIRATGVSLSIVLDGFGSLLGVFITNVRAVQPGLVFDVFYAVMSLLSILAVQWLPEVFIEKQAISSGVMSPEERKQALQASLSPKEIRKSPKGHLDKSASAAEKLPS
ncbi:organic cation transporter 1 [Dermacentor silvarum]|uniref:organic cation transporter 1 n=1 Tax=Dermacentor silvarum TaxID=543639 RepID=UPI0018997C9E|nr:organic cation transporter 1 [Dermacentor silvarum]